MTQPLPLREQLKALEQVQELDLKIDALKKRKAGLPVALKTLDDALAKARGSSDSKKAQIAEIEKTLRQTTAAMELNRDRLNRANSKLETVQNSQEYQAANKEIDQLKKMNLSLEEQLKKSKAESDAAQKDLTELSVQVEKAQTARDAQAQTVSGEEGQLDSEIGALVGQRNRAAEGIERRILAQYDRVRPARGGLGLVPAVGGRCSGCNMMVPPQLFNEIQKVTTVHACPSCHRLLFVPAQSGAPQKTAEV